RRGFRRAFRVMLACLGRDLVVAETGDEHQANQLGTGIYLHLGQHLCTVGFDGSRAEMELRGNLPTRFSLNEPTHHFPLARRDTAARVAAARRASRSRSIACQMRSSRS